MKVNGIECTFHHLGIPTSDPRPGERYSERFGMFTSDSSCKMMRIQWHRFEGNSALHPLIRTVPHAAFKVSDLNRVIEGFPILLGPYEPIPGFRVAMVEDGGHPIEFVETALTDEQIWGRVEAENMLYGERGR